MNATPTANFSPLNLWRRLPITAKLLLPLAAVFISVLFVFAFIVAPSLDNFVRDNVRLSFRTESERISGRFDQFFSAARSALNELARSAELTELARIIATDNRARFNSQRIVVSSRIANTLITTPAPFANLRFVQVNGDQIVNVRLTISGAGISPFFLLTDPPPSERGQTYLNEILALSEGQFYISDYVLQQPAISRNGSARLSFQIGTPIYSSGTLVGALIGDLRPEASLAEILQPNRSTIFEFTTALLDQRGSLLAVSSRTAKVPVGVVGGADFQAPDLPPQVFEATAQGLLEIGGRTYFTSRLSVPSNADIANSQWFLVISKESEEAELTNLLNLARDLVLRTALLFAGLLLAFAVAVQGVVRPLRRLSRSAQQMAEGNFNIRLDVRTQDEIGQLAHSLNRLSQRLNETLSTLESRVRERTRNLEIAAEIGREATRLRDIDQLLQYTVDAIRDRFNFYHAQIFLVDDANEYAVLVTSTGEAGRQLLARKHKLAVGSNSIVGQATAQRRTFITLDTQQSEVPHRFNPLLPLTRSEMAVPLQVGDKLIGCLDVQSVEPNAFDQEDVQIFQLLCDQLAIAIDNARLLAEQAQRAAQVAELNRQLTRTSWQEYLAERSNEQLAYTYDLLTIQPADGTPQPAESADGRIIEAPIQVRGEIVGTLRVQENPELPLSIEERAIVQAVADRVALVLENTRLVEQTQSALKRVEQLYQASRVLSSVSEPERLYQAVADRFSTFDQLDRLIFLLAYPAPSYETEMLEYAYIWERQPNTFRPTAQRVLRETVPAAWLPRERTPYLANLSVDLQAHESLREAYRAMRVQSVLVTPLVTATRWFGVIMFHSQRARAFSATFVQYADALSDQVAISLENQYLFKEAQIEARSNRVLAEAAQIASQIGTDFEAGVSDLIERVALAANFDRWWFGSVRLTLTGVVADRLTARFPKDSPLTTMTEVTLESSNNAITEVLRGGQMVVVNDPLEHTALKRLQVELAEAFGKHIVVPIKTGNRTDAVLLLGRALMQPDIDERDRQLSLALASQIAVALENRRLFDAVQNERESLQQILNSLPTGVIVVDALTRQPVLTNQRARELLGLDALQPPEVVHTSTGIPFTPEEQPIFRALEDQVPVRAQDMTLFDENGNRTDLLVDAVPLVRGGEVIGAIAVYQDVTELRELESVLQESLRETTSLYEVSRRVAAENEIYGILNVIGRHVVDEFTATHFYVIFNQDGQFAPIYAAWQSPDGVTVDVVDAPLPLPRALLTEEPFVDTNILENPSFADDPQIQALGVVSLGIFPMRARNRLIGWLCIGYDSYHPFTPEERRAFSNLTDQAAAACETARLAQETAQALQTTTMLFEASLNIRQADSIASTVAALRDELVKLSPDRIDILLVRMRESEQRVDWVLAWRADDPNSQAVQVDKPLMQGDWDMLDLPPYFIADVQDADPNLLDRIQPLLYLGNFRAQAAVPMQVKGQIKGRVILTYKEPHAFSRTEQQLLVTLADQAAISLDNFVLVQQTQDSLEETAVLYQTSRAIANAASPREEVAAIADFAVPPFVSSVLTLHLIGGSWGERNAAVEIAGFWQRDEGGYDLTGMRFTAEQFPIWDVVKRSVPTWIEDIYAPHAYMDEFTLDVSGIELMFGSRALVVFPLFGANRAPLGALVINADEVWRMTERDMRIFTSISDLIGIGIERRDLFERTTRRARQLALSAEIAQVAASTLRLEELFNLIVNQIKDSFGFDHVQIFRLDDEGRFARVVASTGEAGKRLIARGHGLPVGSRSVIGQVTATGMPQIVRDTTDPRAIHKPNPDLPDTRAEMALPLIARDVILGALDVQSNTAGAFTEEDVAILSTLAGQIAIAIDNAELFASSVRRAEEMRFLFDATRAATAAFAETEGQAERLREIAELLRDKLNALAAAILIFDDSGTRLVPHGAVQLGKELVIPPYYEYAQPFFKEFAQSHEPLIVNDLAAAQRSARQSTTGMLGQSRLAQALRSFLPASGSLLLVPLYAGENFVGALGAVKEVVNGFDDNSLRLMQTLGSSLSVTIQNARLLREVRAANLRLMELDRLKSQFLANMSHELRTPLNSIIGFSRVILKGIDGPLTEMQRQDLTTIYESGKHLLGLVNDILDQAKIEADRMEFSIAPFAMQEVIKGVASTAIGLIKDKPLRLYQEIEPDLPNVMGDEFRTRQALLNLVSNAVKFTPQGSITIACFRTEIDGVPMVQVSVTDTGIGIPRDKLDIIFEPFQQVDNNAARQYEGTGLGLPISRKLIEKQGGRMWVESEVGVGSTFSFVLPIAGLAKGEQPRSEASAEMGD
ncbi:MAG: GAF domain-containing protein [Anaerolineae bacterium]|nr:GAF domain-containing protein [Anaerolineae bacterium]MDW8297798.1 GAF domain-containing protein [Anaerolineae bacterium]